MLDGDTVYLSLGEEFLFPYYVPTLKGWRNRDHVRSFFPNLWDVGHGDCALFLLHEFLGHLHLLITWQGGFNYGPGPMYFGMGGI